MTAISWGQAARPSWSGRTAITGANKHRRSSGQDSKYLMVPAQLRGQLARMGSSQQEFADGFVDFLLGRVDVTRASATRSRLVPLAIACDGWMLAGSERTAWLVVSRCHTTPSRFPEQIAPTTAARCLPK